MLNLPNGKMKVSFKHKIYGIVRGTTWEGTEATKPVQGVKIPDRVADPDTNTHKNRATFGLRLPPRIKFCMGVILDDGDFQIAKFADAELETTMFIQIGNKIYSRKKVTDLKNFNSVNNMIDNTRYVAMWSLPGCLPEMEPIWFYTFEEAKSYLVNEIRELHHSAFEYADDSGTKDGWADVCDQIEGMTRCDFVTAPDGYVYSISIDYDNTDLKYKEHSLVEIFSEDDY